MKLYLNWYLYKGVIKYTKVEIPNFVI